MSGHNSGPRIVLVGSSGQVGWELARTLSPLGVVVPTNRSRFDLNDPGSLGRRIRDLRPDCVVNAAAFTAVDAAESKRAEAMRVNADAPAAMAAAARACDALFVHYSTDYVFDGEGSTPYREDESPNPINVYGESKLKGEERVLEEAPGAIVLRTGWVYGLRGSNFLRTMLRLAHEREEFTSGERPARSTNLEPLHCASHGHDSVPTTRWVALAGRGRWKTGRIPRHVWGSDDLVRVRPGSALA